MGKISGYGLDSNITGNDLVLGSSSESSFNGQTIYSTRNYKLSDLAEFFATYDYNADVSLAELDALVSQVVLDVSDLDTSVGVLTPKVSKNESDITSLQSAVSTNTSDIEQLQGSVSTNTDFINVINYTINENIDDISTVSSYISSVVSVSENIDDVVNAITAAENAAISASSAEDSATLAEAAQAAAEAASEASSLNANVYADTAAGLAATTIGDQFQVVTGSSVIRYRHDSGPNARIMLISPAYCGYQYRDNSKWEEIFRLISLYRQLPLADVWNDADISDRNWSSISYDGIHLNPEGRKRQGGVICSKIRSLSW